MKRRVKSLLLAILMVFTILPSNFTTVEAVDDAGIHLRIANNDGIELTDGKVKISVQNNDSALVSNSYISEENVIYSDISKLENANNYRIDISYEGYLIYEKEFTASKRIEYQEITLEKDTFTTYAFSSDTLDSWRLNESTPYISTNISSDALAGFSQTFYSSDKSIADVDNSGRVSINKAGNVTFTARLYKKQPDGGTVYKEISKSIEMKKISHSLVPVEEKSTKGDLYKAGRISAVCFR